MPRIDVYEDTGRCCVEVTTNEVNSATTRLSRRADAKKRRGTYVVEDVEDSDDAGRNDLRVCSTYER